MCKVTHEVNFQWDTFRTLYPLMSLHDPVRFADIVRGMIDIQVHEGTHYVFNIVNKILIRRRKHRMVA
jgi:putative alpha-1,2-mannosidase